MIVWKAVWIVEVGGDDKIPEEERGGEHQVDSPEKEGEEDLKSHGEHMVVQVLRGRKVVHHRNQDEERQDG